MGSFWREGHQKSMSVASGTRLAEGGGGGGWVVEGTAHVVLRRLEDRKGSCYFTIFLCVTTR